MLALFSASSAASVSSVRKSTCTPTRAGRTRWYDTYPPTLGYLPGAAFANLEKNVLSAPRKRMGVFQTTYEQTTLSQYSTSSITWIFSSQLALMWLPGPLYGRLVDTYGPAPVLYPCAALAVFGLAMTSLADEYYQVFLAQGLVLGIGSGGVFSTALICVSQWFARRRGLAVGIASVGSSAGGVVFPAFFIELAPRIGFHAAIRWATLMIGVLLAVACLLVRARLPRRKWDASQKWLDLTMLRQKQFGLYTLGCFLVM